MEEIDLCWRLRNMGRQIVCIPQSTAYHLGGATLNQGNPRKTFLNFRNNRYMLHKNLPEEQLRPLLRIRTILDLIAALQFLLKGDIKNMKAVLRAMRCKMPPEGKTAGTLNAPAVVSDESLLAPDSIIWQYYVKGKHIFSQLPSFTS
jgi:hypothetical protein